jgi:hypothetical protein
MPRSFGIGSVPAFAAAEYDQMRNTFLDLKTPAKVWASAAVLAAAVSVTSSVPASALDDGQANIFDTLLGILTVSPMERNEAKAEIDYRERAPLVLPPKMELRQPQTPGAGRSAEWPQDPDVMRRRKAALEASRAKGSPAKGNDVLSKQDLNAGRYAGTAPEAPKPHCGDNQHNCLYVNPDELRAGGGFDPASKEVAVGEEPDRDYLTQPPKGYRVVTKKVQATFEAPFKQKDEQADPKNYWKAKPADE